MLWFAAWKIFACVLEGKIAKLSNAMVLRARKVGRDRGFLKDSFLLQLSKPQLHQSSSMGVRKGYDNREPSNSALG